MREKLNFKIKKKKYLGKQIVAEEVEEALDGPARLVISRPIGERCRISRKQRRSTERAVTVVILIAAAAFVVKPPVNTVAMEHVAAIPELSDFFMVFERTEANRARVADHRRRRSLHRVAKRRHGKALFDGL